MNCSYCSVKVDLPFRCHYCGQFFCPAHRLPESHSCPEIWRAKILRPPEVTPLYQRVEARAGQRRGVLETLRFGPEEIKHLAVGAGLVSAAGLSYIAGRSQNPITLIISLVFFTMGFLLHELAHKFMARSFYLWAEFRLDVFGALLTLISVFSPFFKIIAPGAVVIAGAPTRSQLGMTAAVGPLVNVILSTALLPGSFMATDRAIASAFLAGAYINAFIALFNLVPLGMLDGRKVFWWNKAVWAVMLAVSLALVVVINFIRI